VKVAYMRAAAAHLDGAREREKWDPPSMFRDVAAAVQGAIVPLVEQFGAAGQARGVVRAAR
jgi:hypothetical protein